MADRRCRDVIPNAGDDRQPIDWAGPVLHGVLVLSAGDIATELRLDVKVVRSAIRNGQLKAVRDGNAFKVPPAEFADRVQRCRIEPQYRLRRQ